MGLIAGRSREIAELVDHTELVELSLQRMISDLREAESGVPSYMVTSEARYLDLTHAAAFSSRRGLKNDADFDSIGVLAIEMRGGADERVAHCKIASPRTEKCFLTSLVGNCGVNLLVIAALYRGTLLYIYIRYIGEMEDRISRLNAEPDQRVRAWTASIQTREQLLNTSVRHGPAAVAMLDRDMKYLQVSDRWCTDYALDAVSLVGRSHYEVFPESRSNPYRRALAGETLREEELLHQGDGDLKWLHWDLRPRGNWDGMPEGILIFREDITAREKTEERLRDSFASIRALLEKVPGALRVAGSRQRHGFRRAAGRAKTGLGICEHERARSAREWNAGLLINAGARHRNVCLGCGQGCTT